MMSDGSLHDISSPARYLRKQEARRMRSRRQNNISYNEANTTLNTPSNTRSTPVHSLPYLALHFTEQ